LSLTSTTVAAFKFVAGRLALCNTCASSRIDGNDLLMNRQLN
jgi:hypothetical protein